MTFSFLNLLQSLIAFQGVFFGLHLVVGKRGKVSANRLFAALLFLLATHMFSNLAVDLGFLESRFSLPQLFGLLYGPLLYLHTRALAYRSVSFGPEHLLHATPFLASLFLWPFGNLPVHTLAVSIFASLGAYLALSFLLLRHYRNVLGETHARSGPATLSWLRSILWILSTVWAINIAAYTSPLVASGLLEMALTASLFLLLLLLVTVVVVAGLRQPELFSGITVEDEVIAREGIARHRKALSDSEVESRLLCQLESFMQKERPFLDPGLTIAGLASQTGIPVRTLSGLVNSHFETNFCDFVNAYRVKAAEARLRDPEAAADSVLEILYEVGFNSKSSFNAAFKRRTGLTPSQYKREHAALASPRDH